MLTPHAHLRLCDLNYREWLNLLIQGSLYSSFLLLQYSWDEMKASICSNYHLIEYKLPDVVTTCGSAICVAVIIRQYDHI